MHSMPQPGINPNKSKILLHKAINNQHPPIQKLINSVGIPPLLIIPPMFHPGDFSNRRQYILQNHEVQTNIHIEYGGDESEE